MLIGVNVSMAQLTLTQAANEPIIGDKWDSFEYDSVSVVIPKSVGSGQTWNFNTLTPTTFSQFGTYTTAISTASPSSYPSCNLAFARGASGSADYYKSSTNKMEILGFADVSNFDQVVFSSPGVWYNWPISFGSIYSGTFTATETYSATLISAWTGTNSYSASGTGTVILPGGNIHTNCLQFKRVIDINITGANASQMHMVTYEYFSSTKKLPILRVEYNTITKGSVISKSCWITADKTALNVGVNELSVTKNDLLVYPNPTKDLINIQLPNNSVAQTLEVLDINGRVVASVKNANSVSLSGLTKGVYYVRVSHQESVLHKPVVLLD